MHKSEYDFYFEAVDHTPFGRVHGSLWNVKHMRGVAIRADNSFRLYIHKKCVKKTLREGTE